tara:strand:+ start:8239 stop:9117 length:879 start_codon:yes stop_codon:yes gene_type:complete
MSLPNLMCIGASKSGTTSLYDILVQHSEIDKPHFKEPHFFDIPFIYQKGISWYNKTYFKKSKSKYRIDFTPTYLFEEKAPKRILKHLGGKIKFIVILRNPVDRAYSHYLHSCRNLHEKLTFKKALISEKKRTCSNDINYLEKLRYSYISQGLYYKMLVNYFNFFPIENFLIINFEQDLINRRKETIKKIFNFLEINNEEINIFIKSNQARVNRINLFDTLINKKGSWRSFIKYIVPSTRFRQFIKNKIRNLNTKTYNPPKLLENDKKNIYEQYFKKDTELLEKLIDRKMNWF